MAETSPLAAWDSFRFQAAQPMLAAIFPACRPKADGAAFAVYMEGISESSRRAWFATWDTAGSPPYERSGDGSWYDRLGKPNTTLGKRSRRLCLVRDHDRYFDESVPERDDPPPPPPLVFAHYFNQEIRDTRAHWDGYVFDFRDQPVRRALDLLTVISPAPR